MKIHNWGLGRHPESGWGTLTTEAEAILHVHSQILN